MAFRSPKQPPFSLTQLPFTLMTVPGPIGRLLWEPPCGIASCMLFTSSAVDVTASSALGLLLVSKETFMNPEDFHESIS